MRLLFNWRRKSMKKSVLKFLRDWACAFFASAFLFASVSCNVGLGESVDTESPKLEITYPPVSAAIRDSFILYGTCSDDKEVTNVKVTMMNTGTNETVLSEVSAQVNSETWQIKLNSYDASNSSYYNGWQFPDGTYQVNVTAYDNAGHSSGTASRTFDIDNTAPVFIISNPGVVKDSSSKASAYGSIFTIDGTIYDAHTIESMDVTVYDSDGTVVSKETYNGEEIQSFHEDDIQTAGGTSVTIAQYGENDSNGRYKELHSADSGTEEYTASIKLTDSARVYQNPTGSTTRSASETKADETGNSTYSLYLYDSVYKSLMSKSKGKGLSASDLYNILNKTATNDEAKEILDAKVIDTEGKSDANNLYFSLNPQANPSYIVNGFDYDFKENGTLQTASSGNTLSITVSAGLDNYKIDLDGDDDTNTTVKVWMKEFSTRPTDENSILNELSKLASNVTSLEKNDFSDKTQSFVEYGKETETSKVTEFNGYQLIYDYGQSSDLNESSVSTKTFSVTIPEGSVSLGKYYIIAVTGSDVEDVVFLQNTAYGFEGNEAGVAPTVVIASPEGASLQKSSDFAFSGTATLSSGSLYVTELKATLTVTDQNTNTTIGTYTEDISRTSADAVLSGSDALVCADGTNWTFTPSLLSKYAEIQAAEDSKKSYIYTLEIYGKSSSGHDTTVSSYVQIDSTPPVVEIASITPTVDGGEYDSSENTYVNGTITVKGNIEETNLEKVTMQVFVGGEAASCFTDLNGNATDTLSLGKVYSFTQTIDTTSLSDEKSLDIRVTATDKVGNSTTYSSLTAKGTSYGKLEILQETDRPKITLGNSSNSSSFTSDSSNISEANGNLFGTTSNNQLTATISDDDNIALVKVTVYDESGNLLDGTKVHSAYNNANPYTVNPNKSSASLTYYLPPDEGVYQVCIDAYDYLETETYTKSTGKGTTGKYFIAVSAGAPSVTVDSYSNYQPKSPAFSGKVSTFATGITATFVGADSSNSKTYQKTLADQPTTFTATKTDGTWSGAIAENASTLSDGEYSILFTAQNKYGQTSSTTVIFTVDTNAPTVTPVSGSAVVGLDDSRYVTLAATVNDSRSSEFTSGLAAAYYIVTQSETSWQTTDSSNESTYVSSSTLSSSWSTLSQGKENWNATLYLDEANYNADATVYVYFAAVDQAGNIGVSSGYETLTLDKTQPSVVLYQDDSCATEISSSSANPWARNGTQVLDGKITFFAKVTDTNVASENGLTASSSDTTASNVEVVSTNSTTDGYKIYKVTMPVDTAGITTSAEFKGHDANGRESTTASVYVKCDIVAPEISDVTATATVTTSDSPAKYINQSNSAKVSGKITENNISTVTVYLLTDSSATSVSSSDKNAAAAATATSTAGEYTWDATVTGVDDGTYYVAVVATDTFGNTTTKTNLLTYVVDITSPEVGALSVKSGENEISSVNIASKDSDITISATAKDATSGISSAALYDGTTKISDDVVSTSSTTATDGTLTYTFTISSANVEKVFTTGTHTLSVRATDKAGNTGTSESKTISSDVTAPTVSITDATPEVEENNETFVNGKITVSGTAQDETALDTNNLTIKIYKSDDSEKKDLSSTTELITASTDGSYTLSGASKNWKFVLDTTKLKDESSYVIEVSATDKAGNSSTTVATKTINVKQSTDAPGIEITSVDDVSITTIDNLVGQQKNILAPGGKITATITDDDGIASATVSYQAENSTGWTTSVNLISTSGRTTANISFVLPSDLAEGGYLFKIDVTDTKNETSYYTKETTVAVAVDSGAPEITLSNTNGNYYNATIPVSGSVSDASGKVTLQASYGSDSTNSATGTYSTASDVISSNSTTSATLSDTITVSSLADNTSTDYTATYTATDRWGQSKTASLKYYVDKTAPGLSSTAGTLGSVTGFSSINKAWFKDEALKVGGQITESGSGIEAVYYWLNHDSSTNANYTDVSTATGSFGAKSVTGQDYNYTYSSTVSGFAAGTNSFTIVARDNAGNLSNPLSYTVKVDMTEPEFVDGSMKITVNGTESTSSTLLVNGKYPVAISGTIKDADSKINTSRVYISIGGSKITAKESALDAIGSATDTSWQKATVSDVSGDETQKTFTATIPVASLTESNSGVVYLLITDNAENRVNNVSLVNITVDSVKPTVNVNLPSDADTSTSGTQVNGKITLSGTASDNNELSAITKLEYSTDKNATTWTTLSDVTFTGTTSWTSGEIDTTALDDNTPYYFRVTAKDKAENEGTSVAIELYVSQDTDRPIVKISGLTKQADGSYILKYVKNSVLSGTVSDDDSQSSKIVDVFYISESAFSSSSLPTESNASFNAASGDWTFTPTVTDDGSKEIYFYIKDNAGKEYYTGASSDSSALNLPKIYLGSEKAYDSDTDLTVNNSKFTYVSDSNPPEAGASASGTRYNSSGAKVDVSSDATNVYEVSVNSSFTAGGSAMPKASFTFTATDNNGISGAVIEISDSSDTKKVYRRVVGGTYDSSNSKVTLGETEYSVSSSSSASTDSTSGYYRLDGTDSTTGIKYLTADGTTGTITTDVMDFSSFASGQVSVTFTVYDKSGLYSVGSYPFIVDNAGPDIKVSSPSSTTELTGDVSIIGQSTDTYSSASTIQYVVPTNSVYTSYNSSSSNVDLSTLDWTGSISATSTVSSWTFNLDDADNDGLNKYDSTDSARSTYGYTADDGIYTLPIWFKATDTLGNVSYNTKYQVRHNPDGDKPLTEITYPTENDYSTSGGITAAILNGSIRVTGSSSVPSNTTTINSVYLQIDVDGDGDFDDTDKSALTALGYTVVDYSKAYVVNSEASAILVGFADDSAKSAWWGIAATVKSSSWNISINDDDKIFSAMSGTSPSITNTNKLLHIRASGVNNKGKVGAWSNSVAIKLDSDTPLYEVSLVKLETSLTSNSSLSSATNNDTQPETTASQEYSSNMYIRGAEGEWYLKIKATDNESVNSVEVSQGNTTLADGSGFFHSTLGTSGTAQPTVYIYVPVSVASSKVTYKVSISDNADPVNSVTPSFTLNIDNTAPSLSSLTGNSSSLLSSTVPNISDSDYRYTLKGESSDSGSGFERAVFYFVRKDKVGDYTISSNVIIDPYIAYTASGGTNTYSSKISLTELEDLSLTQGSDTYHLYGKKVSGNVETTTTFTPTTSTEITENKSIREGGLIYVDGVYRLIESIDNSGVVTFSPACSASISSAEAVFPYAQVVDHAGESASDYSPTTWTIAEDDGDGMIENVSEAGASTTWTGTIHACNIPDGPVSLVVLVFDAAGNVNGKSIDTFVSNNAPRLAKVNLATDLNGDNIFKQEEFVEYSMYAKTGSTQESYTLNFSDYDAGVFKIKDALAVVPEFTGGNGAISMIFKKNATDATAVTSTSGTSVTAASSSSSTSADSGYSIATGTTKVNNVTYTVDSLTFTETDVSSDSRPREASNSMYAYVMDNQQVTGTSSYAETDDGTDKAFSFTFWDSTDETSQGSTSQKAVLYVPAFTIDVTDSVAPTGTVTPFYWNGDYSSTETMTASSYNTSENNSIVYYGSTRIGHIDLTGAGTDKNPDISGTIKIEGEIFDDQRIGSVEVVVGADSSGTVTGTIFATSTYTASDKIWSETGSVSSDGYKLTVTDVSLGQAGHTAKWTLLLDTSKLSNGANAIAVTTTQAKSNSGSALTSTPGKDATTSDELTGYYPVRVVPYITSVARTGSTIAEGSGTSGNINRSKLGHYSVAEGEELTVYGWNFGESASWSVGTSTGNSASPAAGNQNLYSFTMTVPSVSGALSVTSNSVISVNNSNSNPAISGNKITNGVEGANGNNAENYSMRGNSTVYYASDDRYFDVWALGNGFANTTGGAEFQMPVMTASADGNLFASWGAASNGQIVFSYGVNGRATPIFNCYDQPAQYTAVAFDKSATSYTAGGASVLYMGEQQGQSGTYSATGLSSSMIIGGAFVTNIPTLYISNSTVNTSKTNVVTGNPSMKMDGDNTTGFFNLANYDMTRRLGSFSNPKAARKGNYLHNIWYDSHTESLKYSVVNLDNVTISDWSNRGAAMEGYVVLDGGYTGQDRLHKWSAYTGTTYTNNDLSSGGGYHTVNRKAATSSTHQSNVTRFTDDIFLGVKEPKDADRSSYIKNVTETSLTMQYVTYADPSKVPTKGDTIALMCNDAGSYTIELRKITSYFDNNVSWDDAISDCENIDSATIYKGNLNVVEGTLDSLDSAAAASGSSGSSADIDLDSDGKPVVAYFDDNSSTLRIAKATNAEPDLESEWVRTTTDLTCSGSVSVAVDSGDNIHVVYKDQDGQMCYAFGTLGSDNKYTLHSEVIDAATSSDYVKISVIESSDSKIPCVTYLNSAGTAQCLKYAYRTSSPSSSSTFSADNWDYMILPSLGNGRYALTGNPVSLEGRKTGWTTSSEATITNGGTSVTPATVQAAVAFKSKTQFETAYLKTE